ncbi:MAG: hypothetical protein JWQ93_1911 [Marmoricola sp.]|nr:hypothetical protein [Marmoricola sp.]
MRKSALVLVMCLGVLVVSTEAPKRHSKDASAAEPAPIAPLAAIPADSLVDSYGVGIHLAFLDTPYADATAVADKLSELGVRHVRDDLFMNNPRQYAGIRTVADRGIRFNLIMGRPTSPATPAQYVDTVATQLPAGSVESVEGTNEWDLSGRPEWVAEMQTRQRDLYLASKANPATASLPVLAPALAYRWNYVPAGDMSQYADVANGHMYPGGYQPSNQVSQITTAIRGSIPSTKPLVTTEAGYHNALNTTNGHLPVPEDVAGVYTPRVLLEHFVRGEQRVYTYELIDEFDDPGLTNPEAHFGLLRRDLTPKPAYAAMKTLLGLASDPGTAFTPAPLPVKVEGYPSDGRYVLTHKRNGQYVLFLWRDVAVYDPVLQQPTTVTPTNVTLRLVKDKDLKVYRPSQGSTPVTQVQGSSLPLQMDGQVTAITIDPIPAPSPQSVSAAPGNAEATVSWTMPPTQADVTGFEVVRQPGAKVLSVPATSRSVTDTGLVNGTSYSHTVRALSPDGSSDAVAAAPVVPATVPSAPVISAATAGRGSVTLTWKKPNDRGRAITGYRLVSGTRSLLVGPTVPKATLSGLAKGVNVTVGVQARNALGYGALTQRTIKTLK